MSLLDLTSSPMNVAARRPKRHGNHNRPKSESVAAARERARDPDGALVPDSKLLASPCWDALPGSTPVSLESRTGCAWPTTRDKPHLFCNLPRLPGKPYCDHHHSIYRSKTI